MDKRGRFIWLAAAFAVALAVVLVGAGVMGGSVKKYEDSTSYGEGALSSSAMSETTGYKSGDEASVTTVRVGYFHMDGYNEIDENGVMSGYDYDFFQLLGRYTNLKFEYVGYDKNWQDMQKMLDSGEIDILTSMHVTPERQEKYAFSYDIGNSYTMLTCKSGSSAFFRGDIDGVGQYRVGMLTGSSQNKVFAEYATEKGLVYQAVYYDDVEQLTDALQNDELDLAVTSSLRRFNGERIVEEIEPDKFYAVVRKDDTDLWNEINYGIEQMDANEGDWRNTLYYKYYGYQESESTDTSYTENERRVLAQYSAGINGTKVLKVCFNPDMKPYSFVEDGQMKGMLPTVIGEFLNSLGIRYEFVVPESEEEYRRMYENGEADVFPDEYGDITASAQRQYVFTNSYFTMRTGFVTLNINHASIEKVGIIEGSGLDGEVGLPEAEIISYPDGDSLIAAVKGGEIDAAFMLNYMGQMYVNAERLGNLAYISQTDVQLPLVFAVNNDIPHEICSIFNKNIDIIEGKDINALGLEYIDSDPSEIGIVEYLQLNPDVAIGMFVFILVVVVCFLMLVFRNRQKNIARRNEEKLNNYEQLLIASTTDTYKGVRRIDLETGQADYIYIEDGVVKQMELGDWNEWLEHQRQNIHPDDYARVAEFYSFARMNEMKVGDSARMDYRSLNVNEDDMHRVYTSAMTIAKVNERKTAIIATMDNTAVAADEVRRKKIVEDALLQAENANKAKTTFLFNMSHDIRTPMNAIIGFTTLANAHMDNPDQVRDYLRKIEASGNHLLSLINDVLDMSRIENGRIQIERNRCSLSELIHNLCDIVQSDLKIGNLKLSVHTVGLVDDIVLCDRLRLNQVLLNLLGNSIKYTMPGGRIDITIVERNPEAAVGELSNTRCYEFHVQDTGIGMSEEFLKHVFEPFEREQNSTVSGIQGTGLGMSITKNVVEMMDGTITVTSEQGRGTNFVVHVPMECIEDEDWKLPSQLENKGVFIVSGKGADNVEIAGMLEKCGVRSQVLSIGEDDTEELEKCILDDIGICMVDTETLVYDGKDVAKAIRKNAGWNIPVVFSTSTSWEDGEVKKLEGDGVYSLKKPIFPMDIKRCMHRIYSNADEESKEKSIIRDSIIGSRILLVDDNDFNREIAVDILNDAGLEVEEAVNGQNAIDMLVERGGGYYDIVIMDVQMPVMDGFEATKAIRDMKDEELANIPIIAMTANAFEEDRQMALKAGMNAHMPKPIKVEFFMDTLEQILRESGAVKG